MAGRSPYAAQPVAIPLSGVWKPAVDPVRIGAGNFSVQVNLRPMPAQGLQSVSGFSKINATALSDPDYLAPLLAAACGRATGPVFLQDLDYYAPAPDAWVALVDAPSPAREAAAGFSMENTGYLAGGNTGSAIRDCDRYQRALATWSASTDLLLPARYAGGGFDLNGSGFLVGGYFTTPPPVSSWPYVDRFDPGTGVWVQAASIASLTSRAWCAASSAAGKGYAVAGYYDDGLGQVEALQSLLAYDPEADLWSPASDLPDPARYRLAGFSLGDKIYAAGGRDSSYAALADVDVYDPAIGAWSAAEDLPSPARFGSTGMADEENQKGYVAAGYASTFIADTDVFDPSAGTWASAADTTQAMMNATGINI